MINIMTVLLMFLDNKQVNKDGKIVVVKEGLNLNLREVLYRTNLWIHLFMLNALCKLCCVLYRVVISMAWTKPQKRTLIA